MREKKKKKKSNAKVALRYATRRFCERAVASRNHRAHYHQWVSVSKSYSYCFYFQIGFEKLTFSKKINIYLKTFFKKTFFFKKKKLLFRLDVNRVASVSVRSAGAPEKRSLDFSADSTTSAARLVVRAPNAPIDDDVELLIELKF